ncbi:flagellar biosynthesis anti-sigma factor FlgM [Bacillus thermotolerans]|uniref:Negative regulator of flagellin synthesis n=1 Tax=Bacillus thermotolerans TaxID=1221996 RepID=A0A0F5I683_BACTR|nr:flagellar biosynthesis anti-sigma factor FlgM [Bacillus thermotolerans]KKB41134.1 Negative regulator of flagellin synthesis [Bacillus thermotolerans]
MKVDRPQLTGVNPYDAQANKIHTPKKAANVQTDKVEISAAAKGMQEVSQMSNERIDKIALLKQQVASGEYKPDPEKIAEGLVKFYEK